ncbi:SulP family inorganic anion transporter [Nocardia takedensis]
MRRLLPQWSDWAPAARSPWADLLAGLMVALVALPLALGFGVSSGMGAAAGLATAVIAGAAAAVFGGSRFQVSGPTGAMTVVLVPIAHTHGHSGVLAVGLLAGMMLLMLAATGIGRAVRYIPVPVIEGFTAGIAVVIALQQIPNALGITDPAREKVWQSAYLAADEFFSAPTWHAPGMAVLVAAAILTGGRFAPKLPVAVVAVALATGVAQVFDTDLTPIGAIPQGLAAPSLKFLEPGQLDALIVPAFAVAALAALESLLSATAADAMAVSASHDPDRELFGQGIANLAAPLFGGVPATGAIARTAVNVRSGARTRLAALTHALLLAAIAYLATGPVAHIPLAAIAGVLLATTVRMVETASLTAIARASRTEAAIMIATFVVTVVMDLLTAVMAGVALAVTLALRAVAREARLRQEPLGPSDHTDTEQHLLREHIVAYRIEGPLFFAAAHRFLLELTEVADVRVVILRMSHVTTLDTTGALVLRDAIRKLEHRHITVLLSGTRPDHLRQLTTIAALPRDHAAALFDDTPTAIDHARELVLHERTPGGAPHDERTDPTPSDGTRTHPAP